MHRICQIDGGTQVGDHDQLRPVRDILQECLHGLMMGVVQGRLDFIQKIERGLKLFKKCQFQRQAGYGFLPARELVGPELTAARHR